MEDSLRIIGAWTKAGIASCVRVQGMTKQDDFLFDCGVFEPDNIAAKYVLITHGHIDHVGACISHARSKTLSNKPANYYVPNDLKESLLEAKKAFEKMDGKDIGMNIIGVEPGNTINFGTNLTLRVFETKHRVTSHGYAIYTSFPGKLLQKYKDLSKEEVQQLKLLGEKVLSDPITKLEMVYTGDTSFDGLLKPENAFIFDASVLIMELTYLDGDRDRAKTYGHVHIQDIIENEHLFHNNTIVFVHISQRYSFNRAIRLLREQLPLSIKRRVKVSLHSFGAAEYLTTLMDPLWDNLEQTEVGWGWTTDESKRKQTGISKVPSFKVDSTDTDTNSNGKSINIANGNSICKSLLNSKGNSSNKSSTSSNTNNTNDDNKSVTNKSDKSKSNISSKSDSSKNNGLVEPKSSPRLELMMQKEEVDDRPAITVSTPSNTNSKILAVRSNSFTLGDKNVNEKLKRGNSIIEPKRMMESPKQNEKKLKQLDQYE